MKKVLVAVDDTKGSRPVLSVFRNSVRPPEEVILLHVQRLEGRSMMTEMLGDAEMETLREMLRDTEYKKRLDEQSEKILSFYRRELEDGGLVRVKTMVRQGNPAEEILKVAQEEGAELIVAGCNGQKSFLDRLITGCVTKDLEKKAGVPVFVARETGEEKARGWRETAAGNLIFEENC
ncbi:MAG: hypothetical protein Kow0025_14330 [Thermodesulfovibrionales bacterium]